MIVLDISGSMAEPTNKTIAYGVSGGLSTLIGATTGILLGSNPVGWAAAAGIGAITYFSTESLLANFLSRIAEAKFHLSQ